MCCTWHINGMHGLGHVWLVVACLDARVVARANAHSGRSTRWCCWTFSTSSLRTTRWCAARCAPPTLPSLTPRLTRWRTPSRPRGRCILTRLLLPLIHLDAQMSPVNEYVGPVFEKALAPLVEANALRFLYGGREVRRSCGGPPAHALIWHLPAWARLRVHACHLGSDGPAITAHVCTCGTLSSSLLPRPSCHNAGGRAAGVAPAHQERAPDGLGRHVQRHHLGLALGTGQCGWCARVVPAPVGRRRQPSGCWPPHGPHGACGGL